MIYFDNAATTLQKPNEVIEAVQKALLTLGNAGRGAHAPTLQAARTVYDTRVKLAKLFNIANPAQIAFTCNATEALNIAIQGLLKAGGHVLSSEAEHNSVLRPLYLQESAGVEVSFLPLDACGRIDYALLESKVQANTKAIIINHASNVTGNVNDLQKLSAVAKRHNLLLVVDASQTAGTLPIDVQAMGIDVLCFTGHKGLLGPQGTGGIYVGENVKLSSLKVGGSGVHSFDKVHPQMMPTLLEAGTLNGHGLAGLNAAVSFLLETGVDKVHVHEMKLLRHFVDGIKNLPKVKLYGDFDSAERVALVSLNIGEMDAGFVSDILWEDYGICVRAGAHCAPLVHQHFGTEKQGMVRFSFGYFNTLEEVDVAIKAIKEIAEQEQ
ncbi:MAG: aminotransferase class V-fold PLP-dependent enzyme, partial [Phascolarctobacterium sp.]|nr:aminotransferase class V-fold PLP-dependent enzyme [Phascolarctobacterium sp.]